MSNEHALKTDDEKLQSAFDQFKNTDYSVHYEGSWKIFR